MSKATSTESGFQQKPTSSNVSTPPGSGTATPSAPSTFNYAAAAAKSKAATALFNVSNAPPASQTPASSPTNAAAINPPPSIASVVANGKHAGPPNSNLPTTSSNLNSAAKASTPPTPAVNGSGGAGHSRRQSAVSMPKATASGAARGAANINFGDQNATLSSSPANQPSLGQHLSGGQPKAFGSLKADNDVAATKEKVTVAKDNGAPSNTAAAEPALTTTAQAPPAAAAPAKKMNFHKLFQKQAPASETSPVASTGSAAPLPSSNSAPALTSTSPVTSQRQPSTPSTPAGVRPPSTLRAPSNQLPTRFEPTQRSPSQQHHSVGAPQGQQRMPSSGSAPINSYQAHPGSQQRGPQSARSPPHVPNANMPMQQMSGQPMWHGAQGMQYYPHPYGPYGHPAQAWPPQSMPGQPPYDGQNAPRSPRHANVHTIAGSLGQQPPSTATSPAVGASPSTSFATPSRVPSHSGSASAAPMESPSQQQLGLGSASSARTFSPTAPSFTHSPSHSQSFSMSASGFTPGARSFQPKAPSKAIRIVNPDTRAAISIPPPVQAASPSIRQASLTVPSPRPSTPQADGTSTSESTTASASISRASTPATATTPSTPGPATSSVQAQFLANVKAKASESNEAKQKLEDKEKAERAEKEAKERAEREAKEKAELAAKEEAERIAKEKEAREAKEQEERAAKAEEEAKTKAASEAKAIADAEAETKRLAEEQRKAAEEAKAKAAATSDIKASLAIDTSKASRDSQQSRAAADVERMAREASSVPPTPSAIEPRTPGIPATPRTPSTPGLGRLPAKPLVSNPAPSMPSGSTMKLSTDSLERRKRPQPDALDLSAATKAVNDAPLSAATSALNSAKFIDNINSVSYPSTIASPKPELNVNAEPGKFRYDRDFLMQFMEVFTDAPAALPPLSQIGMESGKQHRSGGMGTQGGAGRGFGGAGGSAFGGAKAMSGFPHKTTSEERFAIARAGGSVSGGHFANAPMGSFNAGNRSHPISRSGSGSNAIPSRDLMGTGTPAGRTKSNRGRQRDPNQGGGGRSGSSFNPPEKGGPTIPLDQVVPLASSENRWVPQVAQRGSSAIKPDSPEMVQRKVKSLLNKLTLEKFDVISDQIVEWGNKSIHETDGRTLRQVIKLVFEKATDEAAWSTMYAQLSLKLQSNVSDEVRDESLIGSDGQPVSGGLLFRKYLLNRCQEDYERGWAARETSVAAAKTKEAEDRAKKETNEKAEADAKEAEQRGESSQREREGELLSDEYYEAQKIKRRGLGLVRFVGELFKLGTLSERIMHRCIIGLLSNVSDPEEEDVESLCKLLGTVGGMMEAGKFTNHVDVYFTRINEMVSTPGLPSRMKFMLQDLIELRARGWQQRENAKDAGPKTIAQIHQDAAMAKARADMEAAASRHGSRGGPMSRGGSRRGQTRDEGADGFRTVGGPQPPAKPRGAGDLSHWGKIDRSSASRPATFKPATTSFFGKSKKVSEDGSNTPTRTNSTTNMFQALDSAEAEEPARRKPLNLAPRTKPMGAEAEAEAEPEEGEVEGAGEAEAEEEVTAPKILSQEDIERKVKNDIREFKEIKDLTEGVLSTKALPASHRSDFVRLISAEAIEGKEDPAKLVASLFARLREEDVLDEDMAVSGVQPVLEFLDDSSIDAPNAYKFMALLLNALNLSEQKLDEATSTMQGEGIKTPKERLLAKMADLKEEA